MLILWLYIKYSSFTAWTLLKYIYICTYVQHPPVNLKTLYLSLDNMKKLNHALCNNIVLAMCNDHFYICNYVTT